MKRYLSDMSPALVQEYATDDGPLHAGIRQVQVSAKCRGLQKGESSVQEPGQIQFWGWSGEVAGFRLQRREKAWWLSSVIG